MADETKPAALIRQLRSHVEKTNAIIVELARDHGIQCDVSSRTTVQYQNGAMCNVQTVDRISQIL